MKNASKTFTNWNLAIRSENLTRSYKGFVAVDNLNLAALKGEIYGFLGSNGAGKTTAMKMLVGLLKPDFGHAWIDVHDVWHEPLAAKSAFGFVPDHTMLYDRLTGLDPLSARRLKNLFSELAANGTTIFLRTHDLSTAESLCHRVGVIHKGYLLVEGSSSELRQIARAPGLEEAFLSLTTEDTEVPV